MPERAPSRLSPHAWAAVAAAALAALGTLTPGATSPAGAPSSSARVAPPALAVSCSGAAIPEGSACIPLPAELATASPRAAPTEEGIPRRPDRPPALEAYVYPLGPGGRPHRVGLAETERAALPAAQRAGPFALVAWGASGAKVELIRVAGQEGDADVVWVGELRGITVVTRHLVREPRGVVSVLLVVGNLSKALVAPGDSVAEGEPIGRAGAVGASAAVVLEARRVREGSALDRALPHAAPDELLAPAQTIPIDPRNVLALRAP